MNKKAFSLIELIVGITISIIIMVSVGVFVNNGMQNILKSQKILTNIENFSNFAPLLHRAVNLAQTGITTSSGILFKRKKDLGEGGFSYLGVQYLSGVYCKTDSENPFTKNVFLKNFIPFEEHNSDGTNEDIFNNYESIIKSNITGGYQSFQKEHVIKENGNIVVGKGIFGDKFIEGAYGTGIYLNSPTGIALNGNIIFISDTLNNRILYLDSQNKIYKLLDESDGLNEPTGLYYNDSEKALYIANSGNGEILKYSSKSSSLSPDLTISGITTSNNIDRLEIQFFDQGGNIININSPTETDFNISTNSNDFLYINDNKLNYYFVNYNGIDTTINDCTGKTGKEIMSSGKPVYCTASGTGQLSNPAYKTFNNDSITIKNIDNLTNTGSYYINLKGFNNTTEKYSNYFSYFTQSDNNLLTKDDNKLEIVVSGLNYPTGLRRDSGIKYNEFLDGTYDNIEYTNDDILLKIPINSLNIYNSVNDMLTIVIKYFRNYNCYNLDDKSERTFILKKNLKN